MQVLAIDPSLTSTGYAHSSADGVVFGMIRPKKLKAEPRLLWLRCRLRELITEVSPDVVVYEDYSFGSKGRGVYGMAELGGVWRLELYEQNIDTLFVPPTTLKLFTANHGFADKETMIAAVKERHSITEKINDDEADAIALWHLGRCYLGLERTRTKRKKDTLKKCKYVRRLDILQ